MKLAIEFFFGASLFLNIAFAVLALFPRLLRHPVALVRLISTLAIATVYQVSTRAYRQKWWFNAWAFTWYVIWGALASVAFAHGWYFVTVCIFIGLLYTIYAEALITFKSLDYAL